MTKPASTVKTEVPVLVAAKESGRLRAGDVVVLRVHIMSERHDNEEVLVAAIGPHFIDVADFIEAPAVVSHTPTVRIGDMVSHNQRSTGNYIVKAVMDDAGEVFTAEPGAEVMAEFSYLCCAYAYSDGRFGSPEILRVREAVLIKTYEQRMKEAAEFADLVV